VTSPSSRALPANIGRRTQRTFFWIALVPVALAALGWWSAYDYNSRLEQVRHTREVLVTLDGIAEAVYGAETGQRGFLLSGHDSYLEPWRTADKRLGSLLSHLRTLVADDDQESRSAARLDGLVQRKLDELRQTIGLVNSGQRAAAIALVETDLGQQIMNEILSTTDAMTAHEQTLLNQRINQQTDTRRVVVTLFAVAILVTIALLFWAQRIVSRYAQDRQRAEAEVRALNADLERRIADQTASLREANEGLRRSNEDLERIAWVATHDLQEPLRMVTSYVALLAKRYGGQLDENADTYIGYASEGARRIRDLVNDLLAYVRVGVDRPRMTSVDCETMLARVISQSQPRIDEAGAAITHDALPVVLTDEDRLATVFQHLIDNALKFRKPDQTPRIHVAAKKIGETWQFSVRDEGIGFDQRYAERILLIFQKLHTADRYPGTGLGLAVSRRIIEGLGGRLWAESEPDAGATFFFTVPMAEAAAPLAHSARI